MKHIYIIALFTLLFCQGAFAGTGGDTIRTVGEGVFVSIDEKEHAVTTTLPVFATQISVGQASSRDSFKVVAEYPEYKRLTAEETKRIKKIAKNIGENLDIECHFAIERKVGKLDVSFVPIVKRKGSYYRVVSCKLAVYRVTDNLTDSFIGQPGQSLPTRAVTRALSSTGSRYVEHSVLSSGRWVKIRVNSEGVYSLTKSFLSSVGFSDPSRVKLYGYGGLVQDSVITYSGENRNYDDLQEIPLYRDGSKILFFAEGVTKWIYVKGKWRHVNNPYSSYSYYFLTEGDSPAVMQDVTANASNTNVRTSVKSHALYEEDAFSWYTSGQQFFDSYDFANGNSRTYQISAPDAKEESTAYVTVVFTAANTSAATNVDVQLNSSKLGTMNIPLLNNTNYGEQGNRARLVEKTYSTRILQGANDVHFVTTSGHSARLDYIALNYERNLNLSSSFFVMSDPENNSSGVYSISSANSDTKVWRIGKAGRPQENIVGTLSGNTLNVTLPEASERYVVVNTSATFPTPTFVEHVKNQDLHADESYDMVVIVPKSGKLMSQAQRLIDAHVTNDSLRIRLVRADELYNEFSSGTPDAMAYRRYLKMLYDKAGSENDMPKFLLLFGDAAWDNRMVTQDWRNSSPDDYLLCYESWNSTNEVSSYVTDDFFGVLDDGEGENLSYDKLDISIGRFPVTTEAEAKIMVDKTIDYMNNKNVGAWKNVICMMGDDDVDSNSLMSDAESIASWIESRHPDYNVRRIYWDAYQVEKTSTGNSYPEITKLLKSYMQNGALIMNYTGHGAPASVSHEKVLMLNDFKECRSKNLPLWIFSSCEVTPFDSHEETIGEAALLNSDGGAVAFISATRSVYSTRNRYLNTYLMENLLNGDGGKPMPMGKALTQAKCSLVTSSNMSDRTINKLKYVLTGDPALKLMFPTERLVIDSINGKRLGNSVVNLPAGSVARISGRIVNTYGNTIENYNGVVNATAYDKKELITCNDNAGNGLDPFTFYDRTRRLFEGTDSVTGGRFSFSFPVSIDASYSDETCLMSLYSVSNDHETEAHGYSSSFSINSSESLNPDSVGPMMYVYLNNPDFQDGGKTNLTPYFVALMEDSDGINATGSGVGHDLELIIDGTTSYVLNDYYANEFGTYTKGRVRFSIPELEPGKHRLVFRAWDMMGNSSSQMLNFVAVRGLKPEILDITCSPNPATLTTHMQIYYDRPQSDMRFHVQVYNTMGQIVYETTAAGQSEDGYYQLEWNLTNSSGARLPGGLYLYRVSVSENGGRTSSKTKKLIILNNK